MNCCCFYGFNKKQQKQKDMARKLLDSAVLSVNVQNVSEMNSDREMNSETNIDTVYTVLTTDLPSVPNIVIPIDTELTSTCVK
jgi:hypothetical protein